MKSSGSPWPALVVIFVVIAILASFPGILAGILSIALVVVPAVLVIAGLVYIAQHLKPPGWVYLVYAVAWLVIPGITLGVSLVAGGIAGVAFFMEKMK